MKFCQRCVDGITKATGITEAVDLSGHPDHPEGERYFVAEGGDTASGQLALGDYALVPETECQFWAHDELRRVVADVDKRTGNWDGTYKR